MDHFKLKNKTYYCEDVALKDIAAEFSTPVFVYSKATLLRHLQKFSQAFSEHETLCCYAVKANSTIGFLKVIAEQGYGADIVSVGELKRVLKAGFNPQKIVFSGVAKKDDELREAALAGILSFNVETVFEIDALEAIAAELGKNLSITLRVNPNIDAQTHPKISTGLHSTKFGLDKQSCVQLASKIKDSKNLQLIGLACHIGSQMTSLEPLREAATWMRGLCEEMVAAGHKLSLINMGGGLGIRYDSEAPPELSEYAGVLQETFSGSGLKLIVEPGRVIAGNTGVLLCEVVGTKSTAHKNFMMVDGSMSELLRPALYGAYHEIIAVDDFSGEKPAYDVVGPVCETTDTLGVDRKLPPLSRGDLLFIRSSGAYSAVMASNYNSRRRPAEVMVDGEKVELIKRRETFEDLWRLEKE